MAMPAPRAIFVSDIHLGCRHARADEFLEFLHGPKPEFLYLVGDVVDGWQLRKAFRWRDTYTRIVRRVLELARSGVAVRYTPGNHDEFLRSYLYTIPAIDGLEIADEFVHDTADGRRLLVLHGDRFDRYTDGQRWLAALGDVGYNLLLGANAWANRGWRACGGSGRFRFSQRVKERVKGLAAHFGNFEEALRAHAAELGCDGVVCGHLHVPAVREDAGAVGYYNTGDWVENASALVEDRFGKLELHCADRGGWAVADEACGGLGQRADVPVGA